MPAFARNYLDFFLALFVVLFAIDLSAAATDATAAVENIRQCRAATLTSPVDCYALNNIIVDLPASFSALYGRSVIDVPSERRPIMCRDLNAIRACAQLCIANCTADGDLRPLIQSMDFVISRSCRTTPAIIVLPAATAGNATVVLPAAILVPLNNTINQTDITWTLPDTNDFIANETQLLDDDKIISIHRTKNGTIYWSVSGGNTTSTAPAGEIGANSTDATAGTTVKRSAANGNRSLLENGAIMLLLPVIVMSLCRAM